MGFRFTEKSHLSLSPAYKYTVSLLKTKIRLSVTFNRKTFFTLEIYNVGHIIIWSFLNFRFEKKPRYSVNYFFEPRLRLFTKDSQRIEYGKQISYTIADVNGRIITDQDFEDADVRERSASTEGESKKKKPVTMLTLFSIWSVAKVTLIQEMIKLSLGSLKIVNSKIGWQN